MAGRSPAELEDWTWGELMLLVRSAQKAERRRNQAQSLIAWQGAVLTARCLAGERISPVFELFPFWTEQEQKELRLEGYRAMMERLATGRKEQKHE